MESYRRNNADTTATSSLSSSTTRDMHSSDLPPTKSKKTTKEKIDKLVADGAKNYPAYLKLIYTGDSELSSEDEYSADSTARRFPPTSSGPAESTVSETNQFRRVELSTEYSDAGLQSPESDKLLDPGGEKQVMTSTRSFSGANDVGHSINVGQPVTYNQCNTSNPKSKETSEELLEEDKDRLRAELLQIQDDISTLKVVLATKQQEAAELRQKLSHRPAETDLRLSLNYPKTNSVYKSFGAFASQKLGTIRNFNVFKSVETRMGRLYGTAKQSQSIEDLNARQGSLSTSRSESSMTHLSSKQHTYK